MCYRLGGRLIIGDPNSIPGRGIDSQRDFGHSFHLGICFLRGTVGTVPCTHFTAALCVVQNKTKKQTEQNKENYPDKISWGQTQCSVQLETKDLFSGHLTHFFLSFPLTKKKKIKKPQKNPTKTKPQRSLVSRTQTKCFYFGGNFILFFLYCLASSNLY